jgi:protein-disulfide isomerase
MSSKHTRRARWLAATGGALSLALLHAAMSPVLASQGGAGAQPVTLLPPRGNVSAPIVILLFSDFECPYCARVEPVLQEVRKSFEKEVQVVFKHNPLPIHPHAALAHEAAAEAARQGRFWEMHDLLFANQRELHLPHLVSRAAKLGLDVPAFRHALETRVHRAAVERDVAEAGALGVSGTPTLFVNGRRLVGVPSAPQLVALVRSALSGEPAIETAAPLKPGTLDLKGSPDRGRADAPVTIVEFSDFQCPFCARATGVMETVWKTYGENVRWVFKHNPLDFHADAPLAHRAALAAAEQGKFWEMHDAIFRNQQSIKRADLIRFASTLGLDEASFLADMASERLGALVARDLAEGMRVGVDGTPTFFVNGHRVSGAMPFETFKTLIDRELGRTGTEPAARPDRAAAISDEAIDMAMARGPIDAPVKIRWFADFGSPLHRDAVTLLKRVLAGHPNDVQLLFIDRPLENRPQSWLAHEAAISAAEQGKFWEVHDLLLSRPVEDKATLASYVARLGLDRSWFEESLSSGRARAAVERHLANARKLDVRGTPTFLINDVRIDGIVSASEIERVITTQLSRVK